MCSLPVVDGRRTGKNYSLAAASHMTTATDLLDTMLFDKHRFLKRGVAVAAVTLGADGAHLTVTADMKRLGASPALQRQAAAWCGQSVTLPAFPLTAVAAASANAAGSSGGAEVRPTTAVIDTCCYLYMLCGRCTACVYRPAQEHIAANHCSLVVAC
jgi:hypothetical protein